MKAEEDKQRNLNDLAKKLEETMKKEKEILDKFGQKTPTFADAVKRPPISERAQKIAAITDREKPIFFCKTESRTDLSSIKIELARDYQSGERQDKSNDFYGKKLNGCSGRN